MNNKTNLGVQTTKHRVRTLPTCKEASDLESRTSGSKERENVNSNKKLVTHSITQTDLKEHRPRPGLGPKNVEDLGLIKEDVGLKSPIIVEDVLSPEFLKHQVYEDVPIGFFLT